MKRKPKVAITAAATLVLALIAGLLILPLNPQRPPECYAFTKGPNLDWENIETDAELEACLLIVAKDLQTPLRMSQWLQSQGFASGEPYDPSGAGNETLVSTHWINSNNSSVFPYGTWDDRLKERVMVFTRSVIPYPIFPSFLPPGSYRVNISYFNNGTVEVDAGPNYL